ARLEGRRTPRQSVLSRTSALLFPAGRGLLPIGQAVAGRLGLAPTLAGGGDGALVIAIEQVDDAGEVIEIGRGAAVDQDQHRGAVRVLGIGAEPNRLLLRVAVAGRTVRQEAGVAI